MLWLSLIFVEPPSFRDSANDGRFRYRIMPLLAFEWFVALVFLGECLLRLYSFGKLWFFGINLHVARVVLLTILLCDLCIATATRGTFFRFSRVFRPCFLMLFMRDLRRQYNIVSACIPYVLELMVLWVVISSIFARIGYHLFYFIEGDIEDHTSLYLQSEFEQGLAPYDDKMGAYCQEAVDDETMTNCADFFSSSVWICMCSVTTEFLFHMDMLLRVTSLPVAMFACCLCITQLYVT